MSDTWRAAALLVGQLPDDKKEALAVLQCTKELIEFIYDPQRISRGAVLQLVSVGRPGHNPSFVAIAGESLSMSPNKIQSDDSPAKS